MTRARWAAFGPPLALLLVALGFTAMAQRFGAASRAMPQLVGGAVLVLCGLDLASRGQTRAGRLIAAWLNPAGRDAAAPAPDAAYARRQAIATAGVAGLAIAVALVGTLPAVGAFGLVAFRAGGRQHSAHKSWGRSLLLAAGLALLVWLLFSALLGLPPFPGLLFGGEA